LTCKVRKLCIPKDTTGAFLARVAGWNGQPIVQADIASITYTAYLIDEASGAQSVVANQQAIPAVVGSVIYDTLQVNNRWTADAIGYNFEHMPSIKVNPLFSIRGRRYLLVYTLVPTNSSLENIVVEFSIEVE